jgi:hypothetical protein
MRYDYKLKKSHIDKVPIREMPKIKGTRRPKGEEKEAPVAQPLPVQKKKPKVKWD